MSHDLEEAVNRLWNLDTTLKPFPLANAREKAIVDGLHGLAAHYGKEIEYTYIDARGELGFVIEGASRGNGGEYGEDLARMLSNVPHRTGYASTTAALLPENNWCHINHFAAEKLLKIAGEEIFGIIGPDASPKAAM